MVIRFELGIFIDGVRQYPFSEIVSFLRVHQGYVDSEDIGDQKNAAEPFEALCTKRPEARVARWKPRNDQSSGRASRCGCHTAALANSFDATWKMSWC